MADETQTENTAQPNESLHKSPENMDSSQNDTGLNKIHGLYEDVQSCVSAIFEGGTNASENESHNSDQENDTKQLQDKTEIRNVLMEVVNLVNHDRPTRIYSFSPDQYTHSSITAQALAAYLSQLDQQRIKKLAACMKSDCTHWLAKLFNFENASASYHDHQWQGLERVCRLALLAKYPKYGTEGFTALYTRPPVIYVSTACAPGLGQHLCSQLGFPQSSICKVPCNTVFGSNHTLDIAAFERLFNDDVACGKTPLLLVAYAGTPLAGHTDNLGRLRELCTQNGLWLHVEGDNLAALALPTVPPSLKSASSCDSMTAHISKWFALPGGVPFCTFFRAKDPVLAESAGLTKPPSPERLSILPLWTSIQNIGLDKMKNMVLDGAHLAQQLCLGIDSIPSMKRIAQSHCTSLGVVFKYRASLIPVSPSTSTEDSQEESEADDEQDDQDLKVEHSDNEEVPQSVQDAMNTKLAHHLAKVSPSVVLDVVNIPKQGCFLKFAPISSSRVTGTTADDVAEFVLSLKKQVATMDSLLHAQSAIKTALEEKDHVVMVDSNNSMVAAALLCFPPYWTHKTTENLSEAKKMELNSLNKDIFNTLTEQHSDVFSLDSTTDGLTCINIHEVSHPNKYAEFVELVSKTCMDLADSSKFLEQMQEMVRKGIEAAEDDLHKEAEDRMLDDGLRQVPLVGSFYNWLSPPPKQTDIKGRTFNLSSGYLQSTEKTYKYHMQVQDEDCDAPPNTPVTPQKTTPEKENVES